MTPERRQEVSGTGTSNAGFRDLDAVLARLEAKVDALPTREWIRAMIVWEVARTTALTAAIAVAGTLVLLLA